VTRPVVGISCYAEQARWGPWDRPAALLPLNYAEQVAAAGGIPVLLPPVPEVHGATQRLDALVLSGGGDIDPAAYAADPHPRTERVQPCRDQAERALLAAALAAGLPFLGICRGLQILNVSRGGTLRQHLPDVVGHDGHSSVAGDFGSHPVRIAPASKLAGILGGPADGGATDGGAGRGELRLTVPTSHHQAIDRLGDGLVATAWADDDTIEAVELGTSGSSEGQFVLAVQWHPEAGDDPRLFQALIAAAARDRGTGRAGRAGRAGEAGGAGNGMPVGTEPLDSRA